jgi:protease II
MRIDGNAFDPMLCTRGEPAAERCCHRRTAPLSYPPTKVDETTDVYHGVKVEDPYRWLEQDVRESDDVHEWVEAQNKVTFSYLATIPERDRIKKRLTSSGTSRSTAFRSRKAVATSISSTTACRTSPCSTRRRRSRRRRASSSIRTPGPRMEQLHSLSSK